MANVVVGTLEEIKGAFGCVVKTGDFVVYAVSQSSSVTMRLGRVLEIQEVVNDWEMDYYKKHSENVHKGVRVKIESAIRGWGWWRDRDNHKYEMKVVYISRTENLCKTDPEMFNFEVVDETT